MVRTLTDAFSNERWLYGSTPLYLVSITFPSPLGTKYFTNVQAADFTDYSLGGTSYLPWIKEIAPINNTLDPWMNTEQIDDVRLIFINAPTYRDSNGHWFAYYFHESGADPEGSEVKIYLHFHGLANADKLLIFNGFVDFGTVFDIAEGTCSVPCVSPAKYYARDILNEVTTTEFANAPKSSIGRPKPVVYGAVKGLPCIDVGSGTRGRLRRSLLEYDVVAYLEDVDDFPNSGRFVVDEEEISYTGRDTDLHALTGLTRPVTAASTSVNTAGFTPTTTQFQSSTIDSTYADWWNGWYVRFTSGTNNKEVRRVSDYDNTNKRFTVDKALPAAPANADTFTLARTRESKHDEGTEIVGVFYEIETTGTIASTTFTSSALNSDAGFVDDDLVDYLIEFLEGGDVDEYARITAHNSTSGQVTYTPASSLPGDKVLIHKPRWWLVADHAITTLLAEDVKQGTAGLPNLAINHSFEHWTDSRAEGWSALAGSTWGTDLNQETSSPKLGGSNLGINSGKGCSMPADHLKANRRYHVVVWAKGSGATMVVRFNSTQGAVGWARTFPTAGTARINSALTAAWARYAFEWVSPSHIPEDMVLEVSSSSGTVSVDELQVYEVGIHTSCHYFSGSKSTGLRAAVLFNGLNDNKIRRPTGDKGILRTNFDATVSGSTALFVSAIYDGQDSTSCLVNATYPLARVQKTRPVKEGYKNYGLVTGARLMIECAPDVEFTDDYVEANFSGSVVGKIGILSGVGDNYYRGESIDLTSIILRPDDIFDTVSNQRWTDFRKVNDGLFSSSCVTSPYVSRGTFSSTTLRCRITQDMSYLAGLIKKARVRVVARGWYPYIDYPSGFNIEIYIKGSLVGSGSIAGDTSGRASPVMWTSADIEQELRWADLTNSTTYIDITNTSSTDKYAVFEVFWEVVFFSANWEWIAIDGEQWFDKSDHNTGLSKWPVLSNAPWGTLYGDAKIRIIPHVILNVGVNFSYMYSGGARPSSDYDSKIKFDRDAIVSAVAVTFRNGFWGTTYAQQYNEAFSVVANINGTEIWNETFADPQPGITTYTSPFVALPSGTTVKDVEGYNSYLELQGLGSSTSKGFYIQFVNFIFVIHSQPTTVIEDETTVYEELTPYEADHWRLYAFDLSHIIKTWDDVDGRTVEFTYTTVSTGDGVSVLIKKAWVELFYDQAQEELATVGDINVTCTGKNITNFAEAIYDILVNQMSVPTNRIDYLDPISTADSDYSFNTAYDKLKTPTGTVTYICGFAFTDNTTSWDILADLARQCRCRLFWEVETNTTKESTPLAQVRLRYRDTQLSVRANGPWTELNPGLSHNIGRRIMVERTPEEHLANKITAYWGKNYASSDYKSSYQAENSGSQTKYGIKAEEWQLWAHDETSGSTVIQDLVDFEIAQRKDPYVLVKMVFLLTLIDLERADVMRISLGWLHPGITQMVCEIIGVRLTPGSGALESVASTDTTEEYGQVDTIEVTLRGVPPVISYVGT